MEAVVTYEHDSTYGYTMKYVNGIPVTFVREEE